MFIIGSQHQKFNFRSILSLSVFGLLISQIGNAEAVKIQKAEAQVIDCKNLIQVESLGLINDRQYLSLLRRPPVVESEILKQAGYATQFVAVARPPMPNVEDRKAWILIEKLYFQTASVATTSVESVANTKFLESRMIEAANQILSADSQLKRDIRSGRWGKPNELWALFGLQEAYWKKFGSDEEFYNSRLTLKEIYVLLYRSQEKKNLYGLLLARHIGELKDFDSSIVSDKPGAIRSGKFLALNDQEIADHVPQGTILWNELGERRIAKVDHVEAFYDREWGIRPAESLETMDQPKLTLSVDWPLTYNEDQKIALLLAAKAVGINRPYSNLTEAEQASAYLKYMATALIQSRNIELNMPNSFGNPFLVEFKNNAPQMFKNLGLYQNYLAWSKRQSDPNSELSWVEVYKQLLH